VNLDSGDIASALSAAKATVANTYLFPFQTHGSIGPSCAVADVRNGQAVIWSGTQGAHRLREVAAQTLGMDAEQVRVVWVQSSGSYGANGSDDATIDAAILARAVGRPVRLQWMRADEHRWSTAGPAMIFDMEGGIDAAGNVAAWSYDAYTPSHYYDDVLADYFVDRRPARPAAGPTRSQPWGGDARSLYTFPGAMREVVHRIQSTPVRSKTLRAPGQVGVTFALESFMDELAAAAGEDPVAFRLRHLTDERASAVIQAAADAAGWTPRAWPQARFDAAGKATGRGIAAVQRPGGSGPNTYVAMVAEVEVDRTTGEMRVTRVVVAHDCGLIINPDGARNQIEGNVIQTLSRTLKEELAFDTSTVTSVDWQSYPILTFPEVPEVEIVLLNRPDRPASGVGEPASCPVPAAVANAVFDATGVRLNEVPFTADRVKMALERNA
jgi:CO/xanthine dehydrogenase Mo-binding subunit